MVMLLLGRAGEVVGSAAAVILVTTNLLSNGEVARRSVG